MKRPGTIRIPKLSDYRIAKVEHVEARGIWMHLKQWQREGLVSIKPTSSTQATVVLTEAGKTALPNVLTKDKRHE